MKPNYHVLQSCGLSLRYSTNQSGVEQASDTLPPENTCGGITVTLENHSMWNVFFRCGTEMILTEQGSRMFPYCRFRISGLQPSRRYTLMMDVQPLDNSHYRWTGKNWQADGKGTRHAKSQPFAHLESPATGQHWMQSPVSFYRMKLTNNISDRDGNTILHPMHRYLPRLHVVQTDKAAKDIKLSDPGVITFSFPQTEFMAVTAYQNARFVQLKVNYNPFTKGLKEDGSDTSFTTFQPPPQTLPEDPEPQSPNTSMPAPDPPASFPESEQSLPFPAELSPLALQLPLSPTFSSIDGDGLSPTPSLADLVQFLSNDVDLGMGVEFSNTEAAAVPCLPVTETHEPSQQVHPLPARKPCKRKKEVRQRRLGKSEVEQEVDNSTYRSMQPNLEEVEEQLFISFTSKVTLDR
uniref:T-box domain-containing protein n=1 Tax=Maylandia zebra TaxID=106582 RepID=A0A3P9DS44_9CICH